MDYLQNVSNHAQFATSALEILVKERRQYHHDRHNATVQVLPFKVNDVVKVHVQVHTNTDKNIVWKLAYQVKGPYRVVKVLDANSYLVQRYSDLEGPTRKYKGTKLYLLPPMLFPNHPLDTMDVQYITEKNSWNWPI